MSFLPSYPHVPLNHHSNLQNTNVKLKAEIAALQEATRMASHAKLATKQQIATEALESENSALQKEIVHLRSRVADLESEVLAAYEKARQNIIPETTETDNTETATPSHDESKSPVNDNDDDDDTSMMNGVQQHVKVLDEDTIIPPQKFGAENEVNELKLCLEDRNRELSGLQKAVNIAEKGRASAEELTCNLKNVILKEHLKNGDSAEILVTKLLDTLEAEKESCRRMEVENTKLRGQVSKVVVVIVIPWTHHPLSGQRHNSINLI